MYTATQIQGARNRAMLHEVEGYDRLTDEDCARFLDWYFSQSAPSSVMTAMAEGLLRGAERFRQEKEILESLVQRRW